MLPATAALWSHSRLPAACPLFDLCASAGITAWFFAFHTAKAQRLLLRDALWMALGTHLSLSPNQCQGSEGSWGEEEGEEEGGELISCRA